VLVSSVVVIVTAVVLDPSDVHTLALWNQTAKCKLADATPILSL